jgi:hypothetical protein
MKKQCSKCLRTRKLRFFNKDPRYRMGVAGWCRNCKSEYAQTPIRKEYHKERYHQKMQNPEFRESERLRSSKKYHDNPRKQKSGAYKRKYGVSLDRFEKAKRCALCSEKRKLVPDHNHETGKYRGPLCYRCNLAISQADKYRGWLVRVRKYLRRG